MWSLVSPVCSVSIQCFTMPLTDLGESDSVAAGQYFFLQRYFVEDPFWGVVSDAFGCCFCVKYGFKMVTSAGSVLPSTSRWLTDVNIF